MSSSTIEAWRRSENMHQSHDPEAEGAIVMKAPSKAHETKYNKKSIEYISELSYG